MTRKDARSRPQYQITETRIPVPTPTLPYVTICYYKVTREETSNRVVSEEWFTEEIIPACDSYYYDEDDSELHEDPYYGYVECDLCNVDTIIRKPADFDIIKLAKRTRTWQNMQK